MQVRAAASDEEVAAALDLRRRVFTGEQGFDPDADRDGLDAGALHVVALRDGAVVGTCRVLVGGGGARLGRMAVEPGLRGRGVGAEILRVAEDASRTAGARRMELHAQLAAEPLYAGAGYSRRGEPFMEEGVEHVAMERDLG